MQHTARTNYVRFENLEGLKQKLAQLRDEGVLVFCVADAHKNRLGVNHE